jgi:hypothetical protein
MSLVRIWLEVIWTWGFFGSLGLWVSEKEAKALRIGFPVEDKTQMI